MYRDFFGLEVLPFNNTPDPRFFFETPDHEEALASLLYAAEQRKGFVLVTGEVGSGKTLLSRLLLNKLGLRTRTAVINNTRLTGFELLAAICGEFEIQIEGATTAMELSRLLQDYLLEQYTRDRLAVVILDEAQNLPMESFEELRMLGNLEADDAKLLQVLMLGQPELQEAFRAPTMRQLQQRIFCTFHLRALSKDLTCGYVKHRLEVAGLPAGTQAFDENAINAVYHHSEGIPRLINQICDNAMLAAYTESAKQITPKMIDEVVEQMMSLTAAPQEDPPKRELARRFIKAAPEGRSEPLQTASETTPPREEAASRPSKAAPSREDDQALDRMMGRLEELEHSITRVQDQKQRSGEGDKAISADREAARQMREQASDMLRQLTTNAQEAQATMRGLLDQAKHSSERLQEQSQAMVKQARVSSSDADGDIRDLIEQTRRAADRVQKQAADAVAESQRQNAELREQVRMLIEEGKATTTAQQERAAQTAGQERAELDSIREMRLEGIKMLKDVAAVTHDAKQSIRELHEKAEATSRHVGEHARDSLGQAEKQNAVLQAQAQHVLKEVHSYANEQQDRISGLLSQEKAEFEAAHQMRQQAAGMFETVQETAKSANDRLSKMLEEAARASGLIENKAAETLKETEEQKAAVREQTQQFLDETRERTETQCARFAEKMAEEQARFESASHRIDELADQMKGRAEEFDHQSGELLGHVGTQVKQMAGRIDEMHDRVQARSTEMNASMDTMVGQMRERIEASGEQLASIVSTAQEEVQTAGGALRDTREQIAAEAAAGQAKATELLDRTKALLITTREQAASMLTGLRAKITQQTEQAGKVWHNAAAEGSKTLSALQAKLSETRILTDRSRSDLELLVQSATEEFANARNTFEEGLGAHKKEISSLSSNAATVKDEIARRFEEARRDLEVVVEKHRQNLRQRVVKLVSNTEDQLTSAEARAGRTIESIRTELHAASQTADRIYTDLEQSVSTLQGKACECQDQYNAETQRVQSELAQLVEKNRSLLDEAQTRVDPLIHRAAETSRTLAAEIEELRQAAKIGVAGVSQELDACLKRTLAQADGIRVDSEAASADLASRMEQTRKQADTAIGNAENAVNTIRNQSKVSLTEIRSGLDQMNKHAEVLRQDLVDIGDEVGDTAKNARKQLQQTAAGVTEHVQSLREAAQNDAEANHRRLSTLREQVEQGAEKIRENAGSLLDQVQVGATSLREHAGRLLSQTQAGSDKIGEQAANLLTQAHSSAECFREQAESLLQRAEASAATIRDNVQTLRSDVLEDAERISGQLADAKKDISETREGSAEIFREAKQLYKDAKTQADGLIDRADEITHQTAELLEMPAELVEEAKRRAGELSNVSRKVSTTVKQLSDANNHAERRKSELEQVNASADEKLNLLKRHSARVGQLVGIIRQLYGTMDARIERLRSRLSKADDMFRNVPREIESIRQVLEEEIPQGAQPRTTQPAAAASAQVPAPPTPTGRKSPARPTAEPATGIPMQEGSLGDIVQRNQKLNEWLKDVLDAPGTQHAKRRAGQKKLKALSKT